MKTAAIRMLLFLVLSLACVALMLLAFQTRLIYHPRGYEEHVLKSLKEAGPLPYETSQGRQVAWITGEKNRPEHIWLVFTGNGSVALDYTGYFDAPGLRQDCFVLFDYPGYGQSHGSASPVSIRESIRALLPAVASRLSLAQEALKPRLRAWGQSLGCAAALIAMEEHDISRGVLIAPFTSTFDMGMRMVGWPLCELLLHRFDNLQELRRLQARGNARVAVLHGTDDEVIPFAMGREMGRQFPDIVRFEGLPHGHHNDILHTEKPRILAAMTGVL